MKIKNIKKVSCGSKRYDVTVLDNHNFYASGILVHNCQNFPALLDEFKALDCDVYVSVKMNGTSATFIKDGDKLRYVGVTVN